MAGIALSRKALRVSVCAAVLAAVSFAPAASAVPSEANEVWMYAEPEMINQVGTRWVNCFNPYVVQEGTMTSYRRLIWSEPCSPWKP